MTAIAYKHQGNDNQENVPWIYILKAGETIEEAKEHLTPEDTCITPFALNPDPRYLTSPPTWDYVNQNAMV